MTLAFGDYDRILSQFLAYVIPHTWLTDRIFSFLSLNGLDFFIWLIILGLIAIREEMQHKKVIVSFLIVFVATFFLVNIAVKNIVRRERPWVAQKLEITSCPSDFSFPSGHAAGSFAGATIFAFFDRKRRIGYYTLAVLISYSRIYLQCHYLGDVIIGALSGYSIAWTYIRFYTHRIKL